MFCVLEVLCRRFHRTYLSPLQVVRLAHHQIEVAVVVDAGTQTRIIIHKFLFCHLKHKPDSFIVRLSTLVHKVDMYGGSCSLRFVVTDWGSSVGERRYDSGLFVCKGLGRGYGELGVKVTLWCRC